MPYGPPGIQALFGFQLTAVFNEGFSTKLSEGQQHIHFVSILLTVIAVALVMAPAALHRQIDPLSVSQRFIQQATTLLLLSMLPLAMSICLEIYLIGEIITKSARVGLLSALLLFLYSYIYGLLFRALSADGIDQLANDANGQSCRSFLPRLRRAVFRGATRSGFSWKIKWSE